MERIAVFPGSFDPMTIGHINIIERAAKMFDKLYIAIGTNASKIPMFEIHKRVDWIERIFQYSRLDVNVVPYTGLTIDLCETVGAKFIVRGIRYVNDFESEKIIADANRNLSEIETVFLTCLPIHSWISSTVVRDIHRNGGDIKGLVPEIIYKELNVGR